MINDPIVEEARKVRDTHAAKSDYDLGVYKILRNLHSKSCAVASSNDK